MRTLITGSNGFIGSFILNNYIYNKEISFRAVFRGSEQLPQTKDKIFIENIDSETNWKAALEGIDSILHLAGRAHIVKDTPLNPSSEYKSVNVDGTLNLAQQAISAGVKRFIYLSSIKVNGEETPYGESFKPDDNPSPIDEYGKSKFETERQLIKISSKAEMDFVIIRPVMVYGPGVKGNLLSLLAWISKGFPLPLGSINNLRDFVSVQNLADLILLCLKHPSAANQIFLVSDDKPISTTYLINSISAGLKKSIINIPISSAFLKVFFELLNKNDISLKLLCSLQVDISKTKKVLGWEPKISFDTAIQLTVDDFLINSFKEEQK